MHVAIAVVGYKNEEDVVQCLEALGKSTHTDFEVVICENGGPAAFEKLKGAVPAFLPTGQPVGLWLAPENLGFGGGVNLCLRESSSADAWWVLNPDTVPRPDALEAMLRRLALGDCEAVGSKVQLADGRMQSFGCRWSPWLGRPVSIGRGSPVATTVDPAYIERRQNYLNGASFVIGRRFLETVGPMREDYFLYCEEAEWCLRGIQMGMRLGYANDAVVVHSQGTTTGAGEEFSRRPRMPIFLNERNKILLTWDRFPLRLPVVIPAVLIILLARATRYRAWRQFGYGLLGWMSGIRNMRVLPSSIRKELF
jgi:N-acetylglucosaminyl-diphospho-decaprenol L-rhamnosyltransferase